MKTYKKCAPCKSDGLILCGEELQPCENCNGVGYIETEIPVEQALEALKGGHKELIILFESTDISEDFRPVSLISRMEEAIKALEECIK